MASVYIEVNKKVGQNCNMYSKDRNLLELDKA